MEIAINFDHDCGGSIRPKIRTHFRPVLFGRKDGYLIFRRASSVGAGLRLIDNCHSFYLGVATLERRLRTHK
jgi:hypothetical protein